MNFKQKDNLMNFHEAFIDELVKVAMGYGGTDEKGREYHGTSHVDPKAIRRYMKQKGVVRGVASHKTGKPQWEDEDPETYNRVVSAYKKNKDPEDGHYNFVTRKK